MNGKQVLPYRGTHDLMEEIHSMSLVIVPGDMSSAQCAEGTQGRDILYACLGKFVGTLKEVVTFKVGLKP